MRNNFSIPKNQIPHEARLYTTAEVAVILGVSLRTVQAWIKDNAIPHVRLGDAGRLVRIQGRDLDKFIQDSYQPGK